MTKRQYRQIMKAEEEHVAEGLSPWVVDECPDAQGFWTIRQADGTPNGNTDTQPIATVFCLNTASSIVALHNQCFEQGLLDSLSCKPVFPVL